VVGCASSIGADRTVATVFGDVAAHPSRPKFDLAVSVFQPTWQKRWGTNATSFHIKKYNFLFLLSMFEFSFTPLYVSSDINLLHFSTLLICYVHFLFSFFRKNIIFHLARHTDLVDKRHK
jgi:hypothetical protein